MLNRLYPFLILLGVVSLAWAGALARGYPDFGAVGIDFAACIAVADESDYEVDSIRSKIVVSTSERCL
jgi:hypothetical protein